MKTSIKRIALFAALILAVTGPALSYAQTAQPTVDDARKFLDAASADLLKLGVAASHAQWTAETDITDDTQATSARLNEEATARTLAITADSHRFDHVQLPPDMRRQIMLLQVNAPAAPKDPKLLAEETQLAAQLTGMYGKGKYCPTPD